MREEDRGAAAPNPARANRRVLWVIAALVLLGILIPPLWARWQQPRSAFATYAQAAAAGAIRDGRLPAWLPPSAREIFEKRVSGTPRSWVRFRYTAADSARLLAALTPLTTAEARRVTIPSPGWASWWPISDETKESKQINWLRFYRAAPGYAAIDPRTRTVFYWTM